MKVRSEELRLALDRALDSLERAGNRSVAHPSRLSWSLAVRTPDGEEQDREWGRATRTRLAMLDRDRGVDQCREAG